MPTYVYLCNCCGHKQEIIRKISEMEARPDCEKCKEGPMERVISAATFILKGSGWAKDGYK